MMYNSMEQYFINVAIGDIINDKDVVSGKSSSLIYTNGATYTLRGSNQGYQRVKKVTREGVVVYQSRHGGNRRGKFNRKTGLFENTKEIKPRQITDINMLKKISTNRLCSTFLRLRGRMRTSREIEYHPEVDTWKVHHGIDGTIDSFKSTKTFMEKEAFFFTAMEAGAVYQDDFDVRYCIENKILEDI